MAPIGQTSHISVVSLLPVAISVIAFSAVVSLALQECRPTVPVLWCDYTGVPDIVSGWKEGYITGTG